MQTRVKSLVLLSREGVATSVGYATKFAEVISALSVCLEVEGVVRERGNGLGVAGGQTRLGRRWAAAAGESLKPHPLAFRARV
jgi:hypothetical protein